MIILPVIHLQHLTSRAESYYLLAKDLGWKFNFVEMMVLYAESSICKLESYLSYKPFYMAVPC